jgi:3-oxoacyl-[acyl-carrier protein] reductase
VKLGLSGKGVVVTGGSRGIGRAVALAFAEEGAHVAICARGAEALRQTGDELRARGENVHAEVCDVSDAAALTRFLGSARTALGRVDVLVHNASALASGDDEAGWRHSIDVDLLAAVRATRTVVPWLEAAGGGAIIYLSSTLGGLEGDGSAPVAYASVKSALVGHSKMMALRLAPKGIRVNCVAPGSIEFPGGVWAKLRREDPAGYGRIRSTIPSGRLGTAEEVANAVVFLASDAASWITGVTLAVDGGQHKGNL